MPEHPAIVAAAPMSFDAGAIPKGSGLAVRADRNLRRRLEDVVYELPALDHAEILVARYGPSAWRDELVVGGVKTRGSDDVGFDKSPKPAPLHVTEVVAPRKRRRGLTVSVPSLHSGIVVSARPIQETLANPPGKEMT